ncbi:19967_t:CDS:2 [Cetraspora pellucida]|uniref:19967_t:CDS:1 n=1 Tax=Cetraspora pellucida TaxID=1433469 RepID=A0A9N9HB24_9GLOM|nr:19967_t:CDS:2 [Cetraspora pellucida]
MKFTLKLIILLIYILYSSHKIAAYIPNARFGHTADLINNKIYFQGGTDGYAYFSDFFYLDISKPFDLYNTSSMPWTDISFLTSSQRSTGASCNVKNQSIFFIGGNTLVNNLVEKYDILTQQWTIPNIIGNVSMSLNGVQCIVSGDMIYVFSGNAENKMTILNTSSLTLSSLSYAGAPAALVRYSATLLPNGDIFYIGGRYYSNFNIFGSMGTIPTFNINNNTWRTTVTSGQIPVPQAGHTATFIPQYNQILIIDGFPQGPIVSLDITTLTWSTPTISNNGLSQGLFWHTSTLFDKYILIAFGEYVDYQPLNNIYLLDISQKNNYKWVNIYNPSVSTTTSLSITSQIPTYTSISPDNKTESNLNFGLIIGLALGGFIAVAVIILLSCIFCCVHRRNYLRYGYDYGHSNHMPVS